MMNKTIGRLTAGLKKNPSTSRASLDSIMSTLGVQPPEDYISFMLDSNGAEGFVGSSHYLIVHPVEQLLACNEPYGLGSVGPGLVIFGSDGGGMAYAFNSKKTPAEIVKVDSISMDLGPVVRCGSSFTAFLEYLRDS